MNKYINIVVILVIFTAIISVGYKITRKDDNKLIIGDISTLTGNTAYYGQSTMKGAEVGLMQVKKDYPELKVELFNEDSFFTPKGGIDAYNKLRNINNVNAVITMASPVSMAVEPFAIKDKVIDAGVSTLADKFSTSNDSTFRLTSKADVEVTTMLEYLKSIGKKKMAIFYMNNDTGVGLKDALISQASKYGIDIVFNEGFNTDTSDYRSLLLKIKQSNADVIYNATLSVYLGKVLVQANELGIKSLFVSYRGADDPTLIKIAGKLADNIIYTTGYDLESKSKENVEFVNSYFAKYNEMPNEYAAESYEAIKMIADIYINCKNNTTCAGKFISDSVYRTSVFGNLSFDINGDVIHKFYLKTVMDGKFQKLEI